MQHDLVMYIVCLVCVLVWIQLSKFRKIVLWICKHGCNARSIWKTINKKAARWNKLLIKMLRAVKIFPKNTCVFKIFENHVICSRLKIASTCGPAPASSEHTQYSLPVLKNTFLTVTDTEKYENLQGKLGSAIWVLRFWQSRRVRDTLEAPLGYIRTVFGLGLFVSAIDYLPNTV